VITQVNSLLDDMEVITLQQMEDIHLMDRIDSKFIAPVSYLPQLLSKMKPYFMVQVNNDKTISQYSTL
jgi:hypothetical protein